jgi:RimJ/RimL family protein N-acetyltransferase
MDSVLQELAVSDPEDASESCNIDALASRGSRSALPPLTGPLTLRGEFVDLRPLTVADAAITHRWRNSSRSKLLSRGAATCEEQARWIAARPATEFNFILELKNGHPVGMLSLVDIDRIHGRAEPGRFLIGDEVAVRGVPAAVEAMKMLYELAFDRLGLRRLCGTVIADNPRMITWQKYLGMREEGRLRQHYLVNNGTFQDAIVVGLLADEYRRVTLPRMEALIAAARHPAAIAC